MNKLSELIDTHCHIHDSEFVAKFDKTQNEIIEDAQKEGVNKLICVGTDVVSSQEAVDFCKTRDNCYPTLALHPHEAADKELSQLEAEMQEIVDIARKSPEIVAIGECGLDYFYHSEDDTRQKQQQVFRWHIELALELDLPLVFHIRDAFEDFFRIIDEYTGVRGVVHSFSAGSTEAEGIVKRGLYAGLNGIMTFTKNQHQLDAAKYLPIENIVLETDAPFLTPNPFRGTINEPKHVILITQFLSKLRDEPQALLAKTTTQNAKKLFNI